MVGHAIASRDTLHTHRRFTANARRAHRLRIQWIIRRNALRASVRRTLVVVDRQIHIVRIHDEQPIEARRLLAIAHHVVHQIAIGLGRRQANLRRRIAIMVDARLIRRTMLIHRAARTHPLVVTFAHIHGPARRIHRRIRVHLHARYTRINRAIVVIVVTVRILHESARHRRRVASIRRARIVIVAIRIGRTRNLAHAIDTHSTHHTRTRRRHVLLLASRARVHRAGVAVVRNLAVVSRADHDSSITNRHLTVVYVGVFEFRGVALILLPRNGFVRATRNRHDRRTQQHEQRGNTQRTCLARQKRKQT